MGDVRSGEINSLEHFRNALTEDELSRFVRPVEVLGPGASATLAKTGRAKIGRNDPCLCGSGKKFKRCCMQLPEPVEQAPSLIVAPW
jgi:uncharacterized protein YecA (UPF0149 family)